MKIMALDLGSDIKSRACQDQGHGHDIKKNARPGPRSARRYEVPRRHNHDQLGPRLSASHTSLCQRYDLA